MSLGEVGGEFGGLGFDEAEVPLFAFLGDFSGDFERTCIFCTLELPRTGDLPRLPRGGDEALFGGDGNLGLDKFISTVAGGDVAHRTGDRDLALGCQVLVGLQGDVG